jgi:hypothetical protein
MSDESKKLINRREALKRTAFLLGGALSAPTILGFMRGATAKPGPWKSANFSEEQAEFIAQVCDIIIPETDTAGAREAGVPAYIDDMVFVMWGEGDKARFLNDLGSFQEKADKALGESFIEASLEKRRDFIYSEHDKVFGGDVDWDRPRPFIWTMKELTISGYFSSEVGMTEVMQYAKIPGYYDGCMPFDEAGGKVWAT